LDDTYDQLRSARVAELAKEVEDRHELPEGTLGRVAVYSAEEDPDAI
jgi:hypothetical protein